MSDAFNPAASPATYLRHPDAERVLGEMRRWLASSRPGFVLQGPSGIGKTLLLRVFARRAGAATRLAYVPNPASEPAPFARWALDALDRPPTSDPAGAFEREIAALGAAGTTFVLLIDDAEQLPTATAAWLLALAKRAGGALRFVLAVCDPDRCRPLLALLDGECASAALERPWTPEESRAHVEAELERAGVDEALRARFDAGAIDALHRSAEGNPASLRMECAALLFRAERPRALRVAAPPPEAPPPASASRRGSTRLAVAVTGAAVLAIAAGIAARSLESARDAPLPPTPARVEAEPAPAALPPVAAAAPAAAPAAAVGVSINARPWASIEIDGRAVGETPIADLPLAPGAHRIVARLADGRVVERVVEVDPERRTIVFP